MHIVETKTINQTYATDKAKDDLARAVDDINAKEAECLHTIHSRFCILNGISINIKDISRYHPDKRLKPNYWEYWYRWETKEEAFLMSRELSIQSGEIKLDITFSKDLIREGE